MFTIDVYAAKRAEGGIGLFAGASVAAGERIWRFARGFDRIYNHKHLARFHERVRRFVQTNGFETSIGWVIGADHDLFMRVCPAPSVIFQRDQLTMVLTQSVEAGTELTCQSRAIMGDDRKQEGVG